ncbi:MAG: FMN-binding negative transcriptional regulator [Propionibacteriaceae bacterium]|nr:FMN-binding negative transcriptional regulator [Propionibacteriaceae bacterium]
MYIRDHFRTSPEDLKAFLSQVTTGTLITTDPDTGRIVASFLPWVFTENNTLTTHIGVINSQALHSGEALVIFMGEDSYVSEEWLRDGAAPSWNYETVHVYGDLVIHREPEWIINSFQDIMIRYSKKTNQDYDGDWLEGQTKACVGVEIKITDIEAKSKLSQNLSAGEIETIASHLDSSCPGLASRMREVSLPHIAAREARVDQARP